MERFSNICFTLNNYSEQEYSDLLRCDKFKYVIIGKEVSASGTPHLQGYAEYKKQEYFNSVTKNNPRLHIERRYGSQKAAIEYCKKDNEYQESGERRIQGERLDLVKIRDLVVEGASYKSILTNDELKASYIRSLGTLFTYLEPERNVKPKVSWYYGPTGSGKSFEASKKKHLLER